MELPPFLLDRWLAKYEFATPPIEYNLASSTGPLWITCELPGIEAALDATVLSYAPPEGTAQLRSAIADFQGCEANWVMATTGASEALSILLCLLATPGGNVVIPDPSYPAYRAMAKAWGLGARTYRLERSAGFGQHPAEILAAVDHRTVAVIVNTPHNPSGSLMSRADLLTLTQALAGRRTPVIVDEVYHPLYYGDGQPSAAGIDGAIVIGDMSKALSIPGLRTGWIVDRDQKRRERIIDARSYFTISGSPLLESLAAAALSDPQRLIARTRLAAVANLALLEEAMVRLTAHLEWVGPQGGTTAFPWFRDGRDCWTFCKALAGAGVLVAPGGCFGHPSHFRIGLGQAEHGFAEALSRIADLIEG